MKHALAVLSLMLLSADVNSARQNAQTLDEAEIQVASFVDLQYPMSARLGNVQGIVVIDATLDDHGNVSAATAISGHKALVPDCLTNVKKWKFVPNRQRRAVVVYDFRHELGVCNDRSSSLFRLIHANFATIAICQPVLVG